jgi:hypothetical protein
MTFEAYLEQYYAKWAEGKAVRSEMKFANLLRTYFAECPNFTEWRCCNGQPCSLPGLCLGRDPSDSWRKLARKITPQPA